MRRRAGIVALALVSVVGSLGLATDPAAAVDAADLTMRPAPDATLDVESGGVVVAAQPGGGVWQSAILTNRGRERFTVRLGGSEWLQPTVESVLLEPGQSETVRFSVAPPLDADPGNAEVELVAEAEGLPDVRRTLTVAVTVLDGVSPQPIAGAADRDEVAPGDGPPARPAEGETRTADLVLLFAIVGGLIAVVFGMVVPSIVRIVKNKRRVRLELTRMRARLQLRVDARRIRRIVEASAATGTIPPMPDKPTRADVKRAEYRRRVAERRKIVRAEEARVRDESRRLAAALWADRVREARELAEQESAERLRRIAAARRERTEMVATLAEERQAAETRRLERRRQAEAERAADEVHRARQRAEQAAARRETRRTAVEDVTTSALAKQWRRQAASESMRSHVIRARSGDARRVAVAWGGALDAATRAQGARAPAVAGEDGTRPPVELRAKVAFLDPLTGKVVRPEHLRDAQPAATPLLDSDAARRGDRRANRAEALDVEALNRQLAAAPSHGTRAASAHSRSRP